MDVDGGWHVDAILVRPPGATGGNFSDAYVVSRAADGATGFLKAMDLSRVVTFPDQLSALNAMTGAYLFERDLLTACGERGMSRVVRSIASGTAHVDNTPILGDVPYIIFERAAADVGSALLLVGSVDLAWKLRSLHHVATALLQLHQAGIAHQDLKASNVLVFEDKGSKVADLGCASQRGRAQPAPRDGLPFAGDPAHAAPEGLYGYEDPEWNVRRIGCDAYHFGSLVVFLFAQASMTALLLARMPPAMRPGAAPSFQDAMPHLQSAFSSAVEESEKSFPPELRADLASVVRELCFPDPDLRGKSRRHHEAVGPQLMVRYVARFDLLSRRAEAIVRRTA